MRRLAVVAAALVGLLALGELLARLFSDQPLLGIGPELFVTARFGPSRGNAAGSETTVFGERVTLDADGFRVPERGYRSDATRAVLILGDSVAFGPGVPEPDTVAGRLRRELPGWNVLNAAVIGHAVTDYPNVVRTVLAERSDVAAVVLVWCLNDLSVASAAEIERALAERAERSGASWIERHRSVAFLAAINEFLRERSKLYLLVRNSLSDSQRLFFLADHELYAGSEADVFERFAPLAEIAELLRARAIEFTVLMSPYAFQVREPDEQWLLPQRRLAAFCAAHGIRAIDALPAVRALDERAFLAHDPMHLSAAGHAALAELLRPVLAP